MLWYLLSRLKNVPELYDIIVATSTNKADDEIENFCLQENFLVFRGSENDVLDRFYQTATSHDAEHIIRITADCPLIDPSVIQQVINVYFEKSYDYFAVATGAGVANKDFSGRFPDGMDAEIFSYALLKIAWDQAIEPIHREHVTPFIWRQPDRFKIGNFKSDIDYSNLRWTVDNDADFELVSWIYENLYLVKPSFDMNDILELLRNNPTKSKMNQHFIGKEKYNELWKKIDFINGTGQTLYRKAKKLIPGGTQLLSKRPEMFAPEVWPAYYSKAKGCRVWDLDGNEYIDMSIMAIGACVLGYADDEVDDAVVQAIRKGVNNSLNCPEEVELAELLIELHPWFGMVRYARSGGEAMGLAVRIARAYTHRDTVMFSGYHGWNDWYLAANLADNSGLDGQLMPGLEPNGVPRGLYGTSIPFDANNIESLREKITGKEKQIAAIVIEPARGENAPAGYLKALRELASEIGAVLIFDEITSGFRMCAGGIHRNYNVHPDMAVFAKSMANGYAMSVVLGTEEVMEAAQTTFISSTNWTERVGPVASLATIRKYLRLRVEKHLIETGNQVKQIWQDSAKNHGLEINITGLPSLATFGFKNSNAMALNTRFTIELLKRGFLGFRQFKSSFAHQQVDLAKYHKAVNEVFTIIAADPTGSELDTPIAQTGFQRLTKE